MSLRKAFGVDFIYGQDEIYLDSATAGKLPSTSLEKINDYYLNLGGGINRGTHQKAINANKELESARKKIASIFSIESNRLSFLPSRETAMINALLSQNFEKDDTIITSSLDDHSILAPILKTRNLRKLNVDFLSLQQEVNLIDSIQEVISSQTKGIVLSSQTLGIGVKRNWREISKLSKDNGMFFILDISNGVGHDSLNFRINAPDIVISSGSIGALGPAGTAFQITTDEITDSFDPVLIGGGSVISLDKSGYNTSSGETKFEPGSLNIAAISALANSLELLNIIGFDKIRNHEESLRKILVEGLTSTRKTNPIYEEGLTYGPIISFMCDDIDSHDISIILEDIAGIYLRSGALCSHLFMEEIKQESLVQVSTHIYNTEEEITELVEKLQDIMAEI